MAHIDFPESFFQSSLSLSNCLTAKPLRDTALLSFTSGVPNLHAMGWDQSVAY